MKTVFLDRDGVLNRRIMNGYVRCPDELDMLPGVPEALFRLEQEGFRLVVVTNQQGIAKGLMDTEDLARVHAKLNDATGHLIQAYYVCPHFASVGCDCRKPKPGLLDQAHADTPVTWAKSVLIGDSDSDIVAGQARGVYTIKVCGPSKVGPDFEAEDLVAAVDHLLKLGVSDSAG